jgi:hypothetical protein
MNGVEQAAGGGADQPQPPEFRVPTPAGAASFGGVVSDASGKAAGGVEVRFLPGHYHNAPKPFETKSDQAGRYVVLLEYEFHGGGMGWSGPTSGNNLILARDGERNLVVMQVFDKTPSNLDLTLDSRRNNLSILAWSFGRWLRCSLVADHCGYAPRSRLASGQNPRAIIAQVISSRVLTFDQLSRCLFHRPCAAPRWWPKQAGPFLLGFGHERGAAANLGLGQVWWTPREPLLAKGVFLPLDDLNHG